MEQNWLLQNETPAEKESKLSKFYLAISFHIAQKPPVIDSGTNHFIEENGNKNAPQVEMKNKKHNEGNDNHKGGSERLRIKHPAGIFHPPDCITNNNINGYRKNGNGYYIQ